MKPNTVQAEKMIGQLIDQKKCIISDKDAIFYALSIGFNRDPMREQDFKYTSQVHQDFMAFPTIGVVSHNMNLMKPLQVSPYMPKFNSNIIRHGDQILTIIKDKIEVDIQYEYELKFTDVIDKGKNTIVCYQMKAYYNNQGKKQLAFICQTSLILIGLGGFGFKGLNVMPVLKQIPKKNPDIIAKAQTFPSQAIYYRLNGDRNPLHIDPKASKQQKLKQPIIHGLATYGTVARAFVQEVLQNDSSKLKKYHARFIGHVYPGETIILKFWRDSVNQYIFEGETEQRKTKVIIGYFQLKSVAKL